MIKSIQNIGVEKRFWSKVIKNGDSGCWIWNACKNKDGYGRFGIGANNVYLAHRVSWILLNGEIQVGMQLDHVCHNPSCVNPSHLRIATPTENSRNAITPSTNKSGFKGVTWDRGKWKASISFNNKSIHLGRFQNPSDAHSAYFAAAKKLYGDFANQGLAVGLGSGYIAGRLK